MIKTDHVLSAAHGLQRSPSSRTSDQMTGTSCSMTSGRSLRATEVRAAAASELQGQDDILKNLTKVRIPSVTTKSSIPSSPSHSRRNSASGFPSSALAALPPIAPASPVAVPILRQRSHGPLTSMHYPFGRADFPSRLGSEEQGSSPPASGRVLGPSPSLGSSSAAEHKLFEAPSAPTSARSRRPSGLLPRTPSASGGFRSTATDSLQQPQSSLTPALTPFLTALPEHQLGLPNTSSVDGVIVTKDKSADTECPSPPDTAASPSTATSPQCLESDTVDKPVPQTPQSLPLPSIVQHSTQPTSMPGDPLELKATAATLETQQVAPPVFRFGIEAREAECGCSAAVSQVTGLGMQQESGPGRGKAMETSPVEPQQVPAMPFRFGIQLEEKTAETTSAPEQFASRQPSLQPSSAATSTAAAAGAGAASRQVPSPVLVECSLAQAEHRAALAAAVPKVPKFRFAVNILENPPLASARPQQEEHDQPDHSNNNGHDAASRIMGTSVPGKDHLPLAYQDGEFHEAEDASLSPGESAAPPLRQVSSPVHTPRLPSQKGGGGGGDAGPSGRDGMAHGVRGRMLRDAREHAARISRAAKALAASIGPSASTSALQAHATAMFRHSTELTTGAIMWSQGELLGQGSYGKVYMGLNQQTGSFMAVKVLELMNCKGSRMHEQLSELHQELGLYKKLSGHAHVVGYIDSYFDEKISTLYIFLEYVPGGSIASLLSRFGTFNEDVVRIYTRQILLGLEYLHDNKIVHRDLKGGNVLVTHDVNVKLADFGASRAYQDDTVMKSLRGSLFWMAPEVIRGTGYGWHADIWSLGCTVIEMLTGRHPWPDVDNQMAAISQIAASRDGPPRPTGCSDVAQDFLNHCLRSDPKQRPTAAELLKHQFVCTPETKQKVEHGTSMSPHQHS